MAISFYHGATDTGRVRQNNEDAWIAGEKGNITWAAVIDGVGGYEGGEVAAEIARTALDTAFKASGGAGLKAVFENIHQEILQRKTAEPRLAEMACVATAVSANAQSNTVDWVHVGDTRLYLYRDGSLVKLTQDHSFVGLLEDSGRLTEAEAMNHPKRNEIDKALGLATGAQSPDFIATGSSPWLPGDKLMLCSDGLTDRLTIADMRNVLDSKSSLKLAAENLIALANERGGQDNITVLLVQHPQKGTALKAPRKGAVANTTSTGTATATETVPASVAPRKKGRGRMLSILFLSLLSLSLLAALAWSLNRYEKLRNATNTTATAANLAQPHNINSPAQRLQTLIQQTTGDTLLLDDSLFREPLTLTEPIRIQKPVLYLLSKGRIVFNAAAGFVGPALVLDPRCTEVVLKGIDFRGFQTAITAPPGSLGLQSVRFDSCAAPLLISQTLAQGVYLTGLPGDSLRIDTTVIQ